MPSSDTRFRPGQSGNPGGRPKAERNVRELAQQHTVEAVEALVDVVRTGKPAERVQAATALLDRGWGRPSASIEMTSTVKTSLVDLLTSIDAVEDADQPQQYLAGSEAGRYFALD
jgi:Family of unknown function (DUF5681)